MPTFNYASFTFNQTSFLVTTAPTATARTTTPNHFDPSRIQRATAHLTVLLHDGASSAQAYLSATAGSRGARSGSAGMFPKILVVCDTCWLAQYCGDRMKAICCAC